MKRLVKVAVFVVFALAVGLTCSVAIVRSGAPIGAPAAPAADEGGEALPAQAAPAASYRQGSTGSEVRTIQQKLKNWGYYSGKADGIYGPATKKAVVWFQQKNGLAADGIVGPATLKALGMSAGASSSSGGKYTDSDAYLLAKLIYAEARGESYTGKVAVGAVVLNRVKSPSFPNTVSGVIYEPYAFTCVSDGQINLSPNDESVRAAKAAMNGWDPTYGCLYYYNPAVATSKWIYSRKTVTTIGNHVFAI